MSASLLAAGGCTGAASFCNTALTYMRRRSPIPSLLSMAPSPRCAERTPAPRHLRSFNDRCLQFGTTPIAYTAATPCANSGITTKGNAAVTLNPGVYFISGTLTIKGGSSLTGTGVTLILLPGATHLTRRGAGHSRSRRRQLPLAPRRFPRRFKLTLAYSSTWRFTMPQRRP